MSSCMRSDSTGNAAVTVDTEVRNETGKALAVSVEAQLRAGNPVANGSGKTEIGPGEWGTVRHELKVADPHVWHPDDPFLYDLEVRVKDGKVVAYLDSAGNSAHTDVITGGKEALVRAAGGLAEKIIAELAKVKEGGK